MLLTNGLRTGDSNHPSLGSTNLLEQLTELGETLFLPHSWFIIKGSTTETARWKRRIGQGMGKGRGVLVPSPGASFSQISPCSLTQKFSEPLPFGFLWQLHYTGMIDKIIDHWQLIQPLLILPSPLLEAGCRARLKISTIQSHGWFSWKPALILRYSPTVGLLR